MNITKKLSLFLALGCAGLLMTSCGRPECSNSNPVFSRQSPDAQVYKAELAKLLRSSDSQNLTYFLDHYFTENGKEFLTVHIQGEGICAKGDLLVNNWQKLSGIRASKGAGYAGAELEGLQVRVQDDAGKLSFVYEDVARIID